ncbi:hypothetical protein DPMN_171673 [Dreissena polymorpha]|uniref:Uncharacterized protein n=1 Tax=Dreissena polymorpha TaxID=45954 RepID=A0A9D4IFT2_DREPO|nr:hypothetical protein DPMN_171673 [Dreissena polymorpha]
MVSKVQKEKPKWNVLSPSRKSLEKEQPKGNVLSPTRKSLRKTKRKGNGLSPAGKALAVYMIVYGDTDDEAQQNNTPIKELKN